MINIKLSQYHIFHLVNLTGEQIKEIEAAMAAATKFVQAGTAKCPIVEFYVENDIITDTKGAYGDSYDGKGFKVSYGLKPKGEFNRFPIIHLTAAVLNEDLLNEEVIPELDVMTIADFNKYAHKNFKFERMDYKHPYVKATYMIKFYSTGNLAANFPLDIWEEARSLHYLFNELNSNRKWKDADGETYDVVRFWNEKYHKEDFYADIYEHTPDDAMTLSQRNFLFKKVQAKEIFFED